jgi:vacuolar protein sorting-associated protein 1
LKERFYASVLAFIKKGVDPTNDLVRILVNAETYFINTAHPNFISGHKAMAIVYEKLHPKERPAEARGAIAGGRAVPTTPTTTTAPQYAGEKEGEGGIFGSFFGGGGAKKPARKPGILEPPPSVLKASGAVSEKEQAEIEVIKMLLASYFDIVKQTCADLVPKYIMSNLVKYAREELQRGMLAELYKEELLNELLQESPETVTRRAEVRKMIAALQKADEIVSTI